MKPEQKRFDYLDFIRVFATFMVLILHCIGDYFNNTAFSGRSLWTVLGFVNELCRTGVPLFFMISGFLLLKDDIPDVKTFYKKRFLKIGIPFLIYDILYYVLNIRTSANGLSAVNFLKELFNNGSAYHLWFVYTILFIYLLIPFFRIIVSKCSFKMVFFLFLISIFQTTLRPFLNTLFGGNFYIYLTNEGLSGYIGYVILGYILGNYTFGKKTERIIYLLGLISFVAAPLVNMKSAAETGNFIFNGGYTINHYIEAAAIFLLFKNHIHKGNKFIAKLSAISFSAYLVHVGILGIVKSVNFNLTPSAIMAIWTTATVILSFLWAYIEKALTKKLEGLFKNGKKIYSN